MRLLFLVFDYDFTRNLKKVFVIVSVPILNPGVCG